MTREEAIKTLKENLCGQCAYDSQCMESCDIRSCDNRDAIRALEQEPCEDAVSRQAVEKITWEEPSYIDPINALTEVREKIRALPSIVPQPKIGKWEIVACDLYMCSKCYSKYTYKSNFCSNCGAKMEMRNRYDRQ